MKTSRPYFHRYVLITALVAALSACSSGGGNGSGTPSNELRAAPPQALAQDPVTNEPRSLEIFDVQSAVLSFQQ